MSPVNVSCYLQKIAEALLDHAGINRKSLIQHGSEIREN